MPDGILPHKFPDLRMHSSFLRFLSQDLAPRLEPHSDSHHANGSLQVFLCDVPVPVDAPEGYAVRTSAATC